MSKEKEILRELAFQVTEVAASPRMIKLKEEWKRHNSLNSPRPMICVSPEGSWREIIRSEDLLCEDELLRSFERTLRMKLYWANEIGDDTPVSEYFNIPYQVKETPYLKGMEDVEQRVSDTGSFHYKKLIDDLEEGLERLRFRQVSLDRQESERRLSVAEECFGDLLKVRHRGAFWWTLGITAEVIKLIGLEDLMIDMYEDPEGLHKLMAWFRDEHLNLMDQYEKLGILSLNNEDDLIASGGIGYTDELPKNQGAVSYQDLWGFSESQETVGISPPDVRGVYLSLSAAYAGAFWHQLLWLLRAGGSQMGMDQNDSQAQKSIGLSLERQRKNVRASGEELYFQQKAESRLCLLRL